MEKKPYIGLFISVLSVSFAAILIVTLDETHPLTISLYRLLFTTLIILPFVVFQKKYRDEIKNLSRYTIFLMIIIGLVLSAHFAFWITSLKLTSIASSVILVTAHPLLVGPVSHFFLKEKLSAVNSVGIFISVIGVVILIYGNYGFSNIKLDSLEGNILAILGGIAAGFYIMGGRKIRKTVSIGPYVLIVYTTSTISLLFICLIFDAPIYNLSIKEYEIILLMAIIAGIFGHTLYNWSLKYIRASVASVSLLGEPIGSSILAVMVPWIAQVPSEFTIIGGGIIFIGVYLTSKVYDGSIKNK